MKKKYGIGILTAVVACVAVFSGMYYFSYQQAMQKHQAKVEQLRQEQERKQYIEQLNKGQDEDEAVKTEGDANKSEGYYLLEKNGYIVVYLSDKKTVYEYTNIAYSVLPEDVQKEISAEKYVETVEELYSFLENYSS